MDEIRRINACGDNFYDVLRLRKNATDQEIKESYRRLAKLVHPDKNNGGLAATEAFKLLGHAYKTLIDPIKKHRYVKCQNKNRTRKKNYKTKTEQNPQDYSQQRRERKLRRRYRRKQKTQEKSDHRSKSAGFFSEKHCSGEKPDEKKNDQWNQSFEEVLPDEFGHFWDVGEDVVFDEFGERWYFDEFGEPRFFDEFGEKDDGFFTKLYVLIKFVLKSILIIRIVLWIAQWIWVKEDPTPFQYFEKMSKEIFVTGNKPFWMMGTTLTTDFLTAFFIKFRDRFSHLKIFKLFRIFRI